MADNWHKFAISLLIIGIIHKDVDADVCSSYLHRSSANIKGTETVSCPGGFRLLSCGMGNIVYSGPFEKYRRAVPISDTECECYDNVGMVCYAWCTNRAAVPTVSLISSLMPPNSVSETTAACPGDSKVLGCHIKPALRNDGKYEAWRKYYPSSSGSCACYDYFGEGRCVATCASNIVNHEIVSVTGTGVLTASCTAGKYVLGCGYAATSSTGSETYPEAFVATSSSCHCYNHYGMICYAICGQFSQQQ